MIKSVTASAYRRLPKIDVYKRQDRYRGIQRVEENMSVAADREGRREDGISSCTRV